MVWRLEVQDPSQLAGEDPDPDERTQETMMELAASLGCVYELCVDYDSYDDETPYYAWWVRLRHPVRPGWNAGKNVRHEGRRIHATLSIVRAGPLPYVQRLGAVLVESGMLGGGQWPSPYDDHPQTENPRPSGQSEEVNAAGPPHGAGVSV